MLVAALRDKGRDKEPAHSTKHLKSPSGSKCLLPHYPIQHTEPLLPHSAPQSRAQSPQGTMLCRMASDHGEVVRFYLLVVVFLPFRHLLPWLLASLRMPPSGQNGFWNGASLKLLETLGKANAVLQPCSKACPRWPRRTQARRFSHPSNLQPQPAEHACDYSNDLQGNPVKNTKNYLLLITFWKINELTRGVMWCAQCVSVCVCARMFVSLSLCLCNLPLSVKLGVLARALVIHRSTLSYTCHMLKKKLMRRGR